MQAELERKREKKERMLRKAQELENLRRQTETAQANKQRRIEEEKRRQADAKEKKIQEEAEKAAKDAAAAKLLEEQRKEEEEARAKAETERLEWEKQLEAQRLQEEQEIERKVLVCASTRLHVYDSQCVCMYVCAVRNVKCEMLYNITRGRRNARRKRRRNRRDFAKRRRRKKPRRKRRTKKRPPRKPRRKRKNGKIETESNVSAYGRSARRRKKPAPRPSVNKRRPDVKRKRRTFMPPISRPARRWIRQDPSPLVRTSPTQRRPKQKSKK